MGSIHLLFWTALLGAQTAFAGPTFVVNSLVDAPAGPNTADGICETTTPGECTLRAAIMEANEMQDAIVRVPAGLYALTTAGTLGQLHILSPMRIEGDGPSVSIIDAGGLSRVFFIDFFPTGPVEMRGLTISGGFASSGGSGGGILNASPLILENVQVAQNTAPLVGGGIGAGALLTLRHSVVSDNRALAEGGGIFVGVDQGVIIEDSRIERNKGSVGGGLFLRYGTINRIERTAIIENSTEEPPISPGEGGGIFQNGGHLALVNSVVLGNSAPNGSALYVSGRVIGSPSTTDLTHVTVTSNGPQFASAVVTESGSTVTFRRSIVTSNSGGGCVGPIISGDYNILESPFTCFMTGQLANNLVGSGFDVLSFNGGFSPDAYSGGTLAAGAVPAGACVDGLGAPVTTDFRGHRRKSLACDIGAHDSGALYKPAQLIGVNLLRNGGKAGQELGLANTILAEDMQPPYWEQSGVVLHRLYGPGFPSLNDTPPGNGHKFLSGWLQDATANQTIDASALSDQIDAGEVAYQIGGSFGGKSTENDNAAMTVLFYSDGFGFLDAFNLGGFTAADRGNQTKLMRAQRNGTLPVGTRLIQVGVSFTRTDGFTNEAFADGLSVTLPEPGVAAGLAPAFIVLAGLARRRRALDA